jgi:hypothetical protein
MMLCTTMVFCRAELLAQPLDKRPSRAGAASGAGHRKILPKAVAVKAPAGKQLSAKQAGKATKHVPKAVKQKIAQNHLDDAPGVFDDRPASERKGKASILDKDLDIAHVTEREFNDIKSMLGIDL